MSDYYHVHNDIIIIKHDFNLSLNIKAEDANNCKKLIFNNYDNIDICIETNNMYYSKYDNNYMGSNFNRPLANSLNNLSQLTQLTFGTCFNRPLANSLVNLSQLTQLTFGEKFNQPIANSFDNLYQLKQFLFDAYIAKK
jgi:hypothetical protein